MNLTALGLSRGTWKSLIVDTAYGIYFPDQGLNLGPCIGSAESQPLENP